MPILITTPDITADTWDGAEACALGSQMWKGIAPALMPQATMASQKRAWPSVVLALLAGSCANRHVRVIEWTKVTAAKRLTMPTWLAAWYSHDALPAAGSALSVPTRKNDTRPATPHADPAARSASW